ncbi:uncharacterized protein [Oscarella lobularis]|uniref:uncharacterized protein n=1 Tax=Oscarella lobularis TaxID=121494 RepID=UPI0033134660
MWYYSINYCGKQKIIKIRSLCSTSALQRSLARKQSPLSASAATVTRRQPAHRLGNGYWHKSIEKASFERTKQFRLESQDEERSERERGPRGDRRSGWKGLRDYVDGQRGFRIRKKRRTTLTVHEQLANFFSKKMENKEPYDFIVRKQFEAEPKIQIQPKKLFDSRSRRFPPAFHRIVCAMMAHRPRHLLKTAINNQLFRLGTAEPPRAMIPVHAGIDVDSEDACERRENEAVLLV